MAVDVKTLQYAVRAGDTPEERAELVRLGIAMTQLVDDYSPDAPSTLRDQAVIQLVSWFYDLRSGEAPKDFFSASGAAALLNRYRTHGSGLIGGTVAAGDSNGADVDVDAAIVSAVDRWALKRNPTDLLPVDKVPSIDASKVATGQLDAARLPDIDAAKITSGKLSAERLDVLPTSVSPPADPPTEAGQIRIGPDGSIWVSQTRHDVLSSRGSIVSHQLHAYEIAGNYPGSLQFSKWHGFYTVGLGLSLLTGDGDFHYDTRSGVFHQRSGAFGQDHTVSAASWEQVLAHSGVTAPAELQGSRYIGLFRTSDGALRAIEDQPDVGTLKAVYVLFDGTNWSLHYTSAITASQGVVSTAPVWQRVATYFDVVTGQ